MKAIINYLESLVNRWRDDLCLIQESVTDDISPETRTLALNLADAIVRVSVLVEDRQQAQKSPLVW